MPTVVVITLPGHPMLLSRGYYLVRFVADYWRQRGVRFVMTTDPRVAPEGDLAWLHLDVTRRREAYSRLAARYPVVVNGTAADVPKNGTATHLVTHGDGWNGPIIVKTNLDYGGRPEDWAYRFPPLRHPWFHAVRDRLPARVTGRLDPHGYPIHATKSEVPRWVWRDRRFVVQRFIAERRGSLYGVRRWFFLGESEFTYLSFGNQPIVQGEDSLEWSRLAGPPEALRAERARLGLDFGKIDYGEVDGELVIYDVNPSPSAHGPAGSDLRAEMLETLAPGLELFLTRASTSTGR